MANVAFKAGQAPWETAPPSSGGGFKAGQAPWEQPEAPIEQIEHPDAPRTFLKNLGQDTAAQEAYLKKQGFETKLLGDGGIAMRKPGEQSFKVLDPEGFDIKDISDVAYDTGAGLVSGAAGVVAGLAGGIPSLGVGALPAAAAASGGSSVALEALRNKLGQFFGIPQEQSATDLAIAGATGAASPLLFGTGASVAQVGKAAAKQGLGEAGKKALLQAQRGGISRGWEKLGKAAPGIGEFFSGADARNIKTLYDRPEELATLKQHGISEFADEAHSKLRSGLARYKANVGKRLEETIDQAVDANGQPVRVNIGKAKAHVDELISGLESGPLGKNKEMSERIAALKEARDGIFKEVAGVDAEGKQIFAEMADQVSASKAFELQDFLREAADLEKVNAQLGSRLKGTGTDKAWAEGARKAYGEINDQLAEATGRVSSDLKAEYGQYSKLQKNLNKYFRDPEQTSKTLQTINSPGKQYLRETLQMLAKKTGGEVDMIPEAEMLSAYSQFANPAKLPISNKGTVSTGRLAMPALIGSQVGSMLGGPGGGMAGMVAGNYAASPLAMTFYAPAIKNANRMLTPIAQGAQRMSPWTAMPAANITTRRDR